MKHSLVLHWEEEEFQLSLEIDLMVPQRNIIRAWEFNVST